MAASRSNRDKFRCGYARCTIFPPTIVAVTCPVNFHPSNGELRVFERLLAAWQVHSRVGSKMVISAATPIGVA